MIPLSFSQSRIRPHVDSVAIEIARVARGAAARVGYFFRQDESNSYSGDAISKSSGFRSSRVKARASLTPYVGACLSVGCAQTHLSMNSNALIGFLMLVSD